jgi:peptide/nickel transport system permease protein
MFQYAIRRTIGAFLMLIVMSIVTYLIFLATPVDAARLTCGKQCGEQQIQINKHALGYDKPIYEQYWNFVKGLVVDRDFPADPELKKTHPEIIRHCAAPCLGYSANKNQLIWDYLKPRVPVTVYLTLAAFVMWMVVGVLLGIWAALRRGKFADRITVGVSLLFYSFPTFFIGLLLFQLFAFQWDLVSVPQYIEPSNDFGQFLANLFLPALTLAAVYAAAYVRITRTYVLETMGEDYLRTAKAKGVKGRRIVFKHTLRAALTPIVTLAGLDLGLLLAGAPITETIFSFPGLGQAAVNSASQFDLPMTVVIVLISATFVIVANLIVDLLYAVIDPRVRY